jgi:hypothetical protein
MDKLTTYQQLLQEFQSKRDEAYTVVKKYQIQGELLTELCWKLEAAIVAEKNKKPI